MGVVPAAATKMLFSIVVPTCAGDASHLSEPEVVHEGVVGDDVVAEAALVVERLVDHSPEYQNTIPSLWSTITLLMIVLYEFTGAGRSE